MRTIVLTAALLLAAAAGTEGQVRTEAARDGTVSIRAGSGPVRVVGWNRAEVSVTGAVNPDDVRLTSSGGSARVRARGDESLEVRVPAGSRVDVNTKSGTISVEGVEGSLNLESMSGSFRVSGTPRMVSAEGISGDFEMTGTTETLRVKTVSGNIRVPQARGFVELFTVSGDLDVTSRGLRRGTLNSISGRTVFRGSVPRDGSLHFDNTSGTIDLRVPAGIAADFDLSALGSGEIDSEFAGARAQRVSRTAGVETLRFSSGPGGAAITARTVSGVIRLRKM